MGLDLLVLHEDAGWTRLWPLSAARPVWALRLGGRCLWEKQRDAFAPGAVAADPGPATADAAPPGAGGSGRAAVTRAAAEAAGVAGAPESQPARGEVLWWNGAALPPPGGLPVLSARAAGLRLLGPGGRVAGLRHLAGAAAPGELRRLLVPASTLPARWEEAAIEADWVTDLWDLIRLLPRELERDAAAVPDERGDARAPAPMGGVLVLGERVAVADGARVDPGAVLDARSGPIVIAAGAVVESLSHVVGPAWIGAGSQVLGGKLSGVGLGPQCRVAGEVEFTVFQGYANKRHQGFLGHAAVGEWVNLGALTTNSDLKNNYGTVRVWVDGAERDSGETKVGCFLGDHVKTGIGTLIATGAVLGPGSNLFGGGRFTPRQLDGWAWWDGTAIQAHRWDQFVATARAALARRQRAWTPAYEAALRAAWERGPRVPG